MLTPESLNHSRDPLLQDPIAIVQTLDITTATISQIQHALATPNLTSVDLVASFLHRIGKLDHRGPSLNSVCLLNPNVFDEAQASDNYRAAGRPPRPLEGVPFTIKDSFKAKGLTVAAGSPVFEHLESSSDAAVVQLLRDAGAVLVGKTNMPPHGRRRKPAGPLRQVAQPLQPGVPVHKLRLRLLPWLRRGHRRVLRPGRAGE